MDSRPRLVMVASNDVRNDARIRKSALAAAAAGLDVTLVALASDGVRSDTMLGPVRLTRIPVDFALRDAARDRDKRRRASGVPLLRPLDEQTERRLRQAAVARQRDAVTGAGAGRSHELLRQYTRGRRFLGRAGARASRLMWGARDRALAQVEVGARWRQVHPAVNDYELAYGPVIDALAPDLIHVHDVEMLPVGARAVARAAAAGRRIPWIYDAHEWVTGLSPYAGRTPRKIAAWADLEQEFIRRADAVVTVSGDLAGALQERYDLPDRPAVVLNIPDIGTSSAGTDVRTAAGLPDGVSLLVYSGGVQSARGVDTAVSALAELPGVHLAVVAVPNPQAPAVRALVDQAATLGVGDRLHVLDPVAPAAVVDFLRTADIGLIPLRHTGSHEFALANKLFEYLHAGVPMVVSDCRAQTEFVTTYGLGAVHTAESPTDLARAVREVLGAGEGLRERVRTSPAREEYTWPRQAAVLAGVYAGLLPELSSAGSAPVLLSDAQEADYVRPARTPMLGIGPSNSAGQAWAWSQALRATRPDVATETVSIVNGVYDYPSDRTVTKADFARNAEWGLALREHARERWTHALIESGRPLFGSLAGGSAATDAAALRAAGVQVGLVFHGSEVRDPRRHAQWHTDSPFTEARDPYVRKLQETADRNLALAGEFDGPMFVSTPDQLDFVPQATWLPVAVDLDAWALGERSATKPLVVHAPSNPRLKGTEMIEAALAPLIERGAIDYRQVTGLQPADAAALIAQADIVIDQILLGLYGVLACEGLASGAVVLGYVGDRIRSRVPDEIPIVETTGATVAERVTEVLDDLDRFRSEAPARRAFVERWHSGAESARVLGEFVDR